MSKGTLHLHVEQERLPTPQNNEFTIRSEAAPIILSDLGLLLTQVELSSLRKESSRTVRTLLKDALAGRLTASEIIGGSDYYRE